jgi:NAD(P)-dependent dehydrogenase (short-subunit alcohol dehydrogenase family)
MSRENDRNGRPAIAPWIAGGALAWLGWRAWRRRAGEGFAGKVVLITGGSRGLGLVLARRFAAEGAHVSICARDPRELETARRELDGYGARVLATACDVSNRAEVEEWVRQSRAELGPADVLVNNAAIIQVGPFQTLEVDDFRHAMAINFWGVVHATYAVLPDMLERGRGRIANVASIGGKVAVPHLLPYDVAKFATVGFSEGLRSELAPEGISVTTVIPGLMRTGSPVNAWFLGDRDAEFTWFSLGGATPLTAMDVDRAARRIVTAVRRGEAEITLTWQAKALRLMHALLPGVTADLLGVVNRLLPDAPSDGRVRPARGMELATRLSPSPLTALMNRAARDNNEYGGIPRPSRRHAEKVGLEVGRSLGRSRRQRRQEAMRSS